MDANGTRYHLLLGRANWAACTADPEGRQPLGEAWDDRSPPTAQNGLAWDSARAELTLEPRLFQFVAAPRDVPPTLDDRRGAGRDLHGNWYWIAASRRELLVSSAGSGATTHFWSADDGIVCEPAPRYGDFAPLAPPPAPVAPDLSGLAVTEDHYLVVGVLGQESAGRPAGLLIFDLFQGGPPRMLSWPAGVRFAPLDMAARPGGGVWILDRGRQVWELDAHFTVIGPERPPAPVQAEVFQPVAGDADRRRALPVAPRAFSLDAAPLDVANPIAIEALPDNSILILDQPGGPFALVHRLRAGRPVGEPLTTAGMRSHIEEDRAGAFTLRAHDFAFVPRRETRDGQLVLGRLYIAAETGNQTFAFDVIEQRAGQLQLEPLPIYLPMRLFGGKAVVAGGGAVSYDFDDRWLPLVEQRRPRYVDEAVLYTALSPGGLLDGREPNCVWHRLFLDACLMPETRVAVRSRAADDLDELPRAPWRDEPALYRRASGSELAFVDDGERYETWELLFQHARGRYLQLELRLRGNQQTSPRIRAMRAYYPRFSYLDHYLPAVYREDPLSASFLDRFLANFEGVYTALEDRIAAAQTLFDVRAAPADALDWLVSWFGVALDPTWEEARRRLFIRHAMTFFQARGTPGGLHMALQLVLDECPSERIFTAPLAEREASSGIRIIEKFRIRRTPSVVLGDPTEPAGVQFIPKGERWQPDQGAGGVQQRYADFIAANGLAGQLPAQFALEPPAGAGAAAWTRFARATFGFVPSTSAGDAPLWHAFLARRYRQIAALNERYRLTGSAAHTRFDALAMPAALPPDGAPLQDWYQFQSVVLAAHRTAHRFTVLLPMPRAAYLDVAKQQERLALARRVLELEKPAHTSYEIKFYWGMFRVGEVRLGFDTLLDQGSRSPQLMTPLVLGQGHLVESYLAPARTPPGGRNYLAGERA